MQIQSVGHQGRFAVAKHEAASITEGTHDGPQSPGTGEEWVVQPELYGSFPDGMAIIPVMKTKMAGFPFLALVIGFAPILMAAPGCSVNMKSAASRVFARADDQSAWHEYQSMQAVPELNLNGGLAAQIMQRKNQSPSVTIVKPDAGYWTYTNYCYGRDGQLAGVSFELRTELGWGYRMEGTAFLGGFSDNTHEFFRIKDGKPIARPAGVTEAPLGLKPTLYLTVEQLPFASMLKAAANQGGKQQAGMVASAMN